MTQKDYYQVLGVERNASDDEIKKKYHLLAKKFHPDKNADDSAEEKFKEINRAYEAIRDAESRQSYELQRRGEEMEARANNMAANPTQYTFRRPGRGFMGGFGFTADDLNDVFSRTFRERNKENTRPSDRSSFRHTFDFGRPEWDSNYNESGTRPGGDDFTFSFSFGGEPQQPRRNRMGDVDDLFEDFFQDPFFMDSFPFSGGPDLGGNRARQRPTADNTSQKSTPRASSEDDIGSARARAEREEVLRKAARDEEARQARDEAAKKVQEAAKKAQEARRKEAQRKAEEERMHDWKNDKAEAAGENNNSSPVPSMHQEWQGHQPRRSRCVFSVYDNDPTSWYTPFYVPSSGSSTRFPYCPAASTLEDYYVTEEGLASRENSFLYNQETNRKRSFPADDILYATSGNGGCSQCYHDNRPESRYEFDGRTS